MVGWARLVVVDPNATSTADVQKLRDAGFTDRQIFAITVFVSLRMAFSSVNDALGAHPDAQLLDLAPDSVVGAVTYGRSALGQS
jgi:alkylhydroperoxidase family enzyme